MPKSDAEIIRNVLREILNPKDTNDLNPRSGVIKSEAWTVATATEAMQEFEKLDGDGWLQDAHTRSILRPPGLAMTLAGADAPKVWPVVGERASRDGKSSLHLRRAAEGWLLNRLEETDSADAILLTHRLLSADLKSYLVYHVSYTPQHICGHDELRPTASRFVHFENVTDESNRPNNRNQST